MFWLCFFSWSYISRRLVLGNIRCYVQATAMFRASFSIFSLVGSISVILRYSTRQEWTSRINKHRDVRVNTLRVRCNVRINPRRYDRRAFLRSRSATVDSDASIEANMASLLISNGFDFNIRECRATCPRKTFSSRMSINCVLKV